MPPTAKKTTQKTTRQTPPFSEGARAVAEEFVARGSDALSEAAGLLQGVEREGRSQIKDVSRRVARRLELVDEEEFMALRAQVRSLSKRVAELEGKKPQKKTGKKTTRKKTTKKTGKKSAKKTTRKKTGKKSTRKKTTRKK